MNDAKRTKLGEPERAKFIPPPPCAGAWLMIGKQGGATMLLTRRKPLRLTRFICRVLLGWEWVQR